MSTKFEYFKSDVEDEECREIVGQVEGYVKREFCYVFGACFVVSCLDQRFLDFRILIRENSSCSDQL